MQAIGSVRSRSVGAIIGVAEAGSKEVHLSIGRHLEVILSHGYVQWRVAAAAASGIFMVNGE